MKIRILALGLVWAISLCGQYKSRHFSWQDYCFNHPAAPFCGGRDYAVKRSGSPAKDGAHGDVATDPFPSTPPIVTPSVIVVGGIDWRFADPLADALVGFNVGGLSTSPLAGILIAQLATNQGLTEADVHKIFDGLSGVSQVALSVRDNRVVVMVTGRATDLPLLAPEPGLKVVPVSGNAILVGHADAVDQAVQRIAMKSPLGELTRLAEQRQASSEFWALGSAALVGSQALSAGVKQFSLTVSFRNRLTSDLTFEFNGEPSTLGMWQTTPGAVTIEGNMVHIRMSVEADEMEQKFGQLAASPLGQRLTALVKAAQYLPVRDTTVPKHTKPLIYGLEGGPKEVNQLPRR